MSLKALYIGILTNGTTSKMRADTLQGLCSNACWESIDTDDCFQHAKRLWKTMAFRLKAGPLVRQTNRIIIEKTKGKQYDLVWIDKGVYIWNETVTNLRNKAKQLVHFTPDVAFHANRSRHFRGSASQFDLLVTTKSFELDAYRKIAPKCSVYLATQAYDAGLHQPHESGLKNKIPAAAFIGLCEPDRENCIEALLAAGVPVRLGGRGWKKLLRRQSSNPYLHYLGRDVFGEKYAHEFASVSVGLGLLSKRIPELHTTRTFEIPACGAMLATEKTVDTLSFFKEDEVLFFNDYNELARLLADLLKQPGKIEEIAGKGHQRVLDSGYDYASVLSGVLKRLGVFV